MPSRETAPKKPRTLNAKYADCSCYERTKGGERIIHVDINAQELTAKQAERLSEWLEEAVAWKRAAT